MPRSRSEMRRIKEILRLRAVLGANVSAIAVGAGMSRTAVRKYLQLAQAAGIDGVAAEAMSQESLEAALFGPLSGSPKPSGSRPAPDWEAVDHDLRRDKNVTLKLLWQEYFRENPTGFGLSQFKHHYACWRKVARPDLSMLQVHHAGEAVQVDYAGDSVPITIDGVGRQAQLFVACLPCSGLIFVDATLTQSQDDWQASHVRLFAFLGGVTSKVIPDNLKVGITHPSYYDPLTNPSYAELIKHYGTAVVPARVRKPKDKPSVENAVLQVCRWIVAPLRNRQFFSLMELSDGIRPLLEELNDKPMAPPREGSRRSLFEAVERRALKSLPQEPYVIGQWKVEARVNIDYHIIFDYNIYSVPYAVVHKKVDVFASQTCVQIFYQGQRIASHPRQSGRNRKATLPEHMPPAHSEIASRTPERMRTEAAVIGVATAAYVERLLTGRDHIEQGIRSCLGILRLATKYSPPRLEAACRWALTTGACSSGFVEQLLKSGRVFPEPIPNDGPGLHGNIRGGGYYH